MGVIEAMDNLIYLLVFNLDLATRPKNINNLAILMPV